MATAKLPQGWIKTRDNETGRSTHVLIPSRSQSDDTVTRYHLVSTRSCDCTGFRYRNDCRHLQALRGQVAAARANVARNNSAPAPAASAALYREIYGQD